MKVPKPKKVKSLEQIRKEFVIASLRRASYRWPERTVAQGKARIVRGLYKCNICLGEFKKADIRLDHINPIVPVTGWTDWNDYVERLLCPADSFQVCCENCHAAKSSVESGQRKIHRDKKKALKSE